MIPYELSSQSPSYQAMVYPNSLSPLITNMVSERYRLPPRWRNLPPLFPVIFDPISYLMIHSILRHLVKLAKMEKRFSPLPPLRRSIAELSLAFASTAAYSDFTTISVSDGEEESDSEADFNVTAPVQNSYRHYRDQIHLVNHKVVFARRGKLSSKRSSSFKNLKLENHILFFLKSDFASLILDETVTKEEETTTAIKVLEFETPKNEQFELVFGNFGNSDIDITTSPSITAIKPEIKGSTLKIGEITCFLNEFKQEDDFDSDSSHSDQELEIEEQEIVASLKSQVKVMEEKLDHAMLSEITVLENRRHRPYIRFIAADQLVNGNKFTDSKFYNRFNSSLFTPNLHLTFFNHHKTECIVSDPSGDLTVFCSAVAPSQSSFVDFDPGGANLTSSIAIRILPFYAHHLQRILVFDPGGGGRDH